MSMTAVQLELDFSRVASHVGPLTGLELCCDLLRPYVVRGDSLEEIKRAAMGWHNLQFEAQCKGGFITVTRFNGHPHRWFRAPIALIVESILSESRQGSH